MIRDEVEERQRHDPAILVSAIAENFWGSWANAGELVGLSQIMHSSRELLNSQQTPLQLTLPPRSTLPAQDNLFDELNELSALQTAKIGQYGSTPKCILVRPPFPSLDLFLASGAASALSNGEITC
jgi:hypothetical protein